MELIAAQKRDTSRLLKRALYLVLFLTLLNGIAARMVAAGWFFLIGIIFFPIIFIPYLTLNLIAITRRKVTMSNGLAALLFFSHLALILGFLLQIDTGDAPESYMPLLGLIFKEGSPNSVIPMGSWLDDYFLPFTIGCWIPLIISFVFIIKSLRQTEINVETKPEPKTHLIILITLIITWAIVNIWLLPNTVRQISSIFEYLIYFL